MYIMYSSGPNTEPCGTPLHIAVYYKGSFPKIDRTSC